MKISYLLTAILALTSFTASADQTSKSEAKPLSCEQGLMKLRQLSEEIGMRTELEKFGTDDWYSDKLLTDGTKARREIVDDLTVKIIKQCFKKN